MTPRRTLLLDHHGVITDGARLPGEWRRLLGEFFIPRFGHSPQEWAAANRGALARSIERQQAARGDAVEEEFRRADQVEWMRDMFRIIGLPEMPADETEALALEAIDFVIPRTRATAPGAAEALIALHDRGFTLYTASGDHSRNLRGYLTAAGVHALFQETYGADLLGTLKTGPHFYRALLDHARIDPADAIVVDDDAWRLDWARDLGMATVLVGAKDLNARHARIGALADLPVALP